MGWDARVRSFCVCCVGNEAGTKAGEEEQLLVKGQRRHIIYWRWVLSMSRYDLCGSCSLYNRG